MSATRDVSRSHPVSGAVSSGKYTGEKGDAFCLHRGCNVDGAAQEGDPGCGLFIHQRGPVLVPRVEQEPGPGFDDDAKSQLVEPAAQ